MGAHRIVVGWLVSAAVCLALLTVLACRGSRTPAFSDRQLRHCLRSLQSPNLQVQTAARHTLLDAGVDALPELVRMASAGDERWELANYGFEVLGRSAEPAIPALACLLTNESSAAHVAASLALIGPGSVPTLLVGLTNESGIVRSRSACGLGAIRPPPLEAVAAIVDALEDKTPVVRTCAAWALGQLRLAPEAAIPALLKLLHDQNQNTRFAAVRAIAEFGPEGATAIPELTNLLNDDNQVIREAARTTLDRVRK